MGRKPRKPASLNTGLIHNLQYSFLEATNRICPEVAESLKRIAEEGTGFEQWAEQFGIHGTWIEEAAKSTLIAWGTNPAFKEKSRWVLPAVAQNYPYGYPPFPWTRRLIDGFHITSYLFSAETQRREFQAAVDRDFEHIDKWAAAQGLTVKKLIPGELEKKMECTALYLYRRWTIEQVRNRDGYRTTQANMWRWITETLKLLDLPKRDRRPARKGSSAKSKNKNE
jgi:hypothetical protein